MASPEPTPTDEQIHTLLASLRPTRIERVLSAIVTRAYRINEHGVPGWLGDRADDMRVWSQKRRGAKR